MIQDLKIIIQNAHDKKKNCEEKASTACELAHLLGTMQLMQLHFEFTLEVIESQTDEQFKAVKKKYEEIQDRYKTIKSKEDLTDLPAKIALATFHDKLLLEVDKVLKKCFKKKLEKFYLNMGEDNLALIKIMVI